MDNNVKHWPRVIAGAMFIFFTLLICLNKILDIPHYLFGVPSRTVSWQIIFVELIGVVIAGVVLFCLLRFVASRYSRTIDKMDKSRKLLSAILGDSPAAIFFIKNHKAIWVSKAVEDILGWPVEKWLKESSIAFIYPSQEEFERVNRKVIYKDIVRKDHVIYEYDYVHKDGHHIPTLVIIRAINKDNLDEGFIFSMIDNTESRKAADLIKKMKESLEQKVKERTKELKEKVDELERFKEAMVDRELRMKELKDEIRDLRERLQKKG